MNIENAICLFCCFVVEAIILEQYASHLFYEKTSQGIRYLVLCLTYVGLFAVSFLNSGYWNALLYLLGNLLFLITQYKLNWLSALFHSSLLTVLMGMSELLIYEILKYISPDFITMQKDFYHLMIFAVFNKLVFLIIIFTLLHVFKGRKEQQDSGQNKSVFRLLFMYALYFIITVHKI